MQLIQKLKRSVNGSRDKVLSSQAYVAGSIGADSPAGQVSLSFLADAEADNNHVVACSVPDAEGIIKSFAEQLGWLENYDPKGAHLIPDSLRKQHAAEVLRRIAAKIEGGE